MNGNVPAEERPTRFLGCRDLRFRRQRVQLCLVSGGEGFLASCLDDPDQAGQHVDGLRHLIEHAVAPVGPVIVADRLLQPMLHLGELSKIHKVGLNRGPLFRLLVEGERPFIETARLSPAATFLRQRAEIAQIARHGPPLTQLRVERERPLDALLCLVCLAFRLLEQPQVVQDGSLAPAIVDLPGESQSLGIEGEGGSVIAHQVRRLPSVAQALGDERPIAQFQRDPVRLAMEFGGLARVAPETGVRAQIVQRAGQSGPVVDALGQAASVVEEPASSRDVATGQRAVPLVTEVLPLSSYQREFRPSSPAEAASGHEHQQQDAEAGDDHSLTRSSRRRLPGIGTVRSSARAARPFAAKVLIGKVCFAPITISSTSCSVPSTDRKRGGTSSVTAFTLSTAPCNESTTPGSLPVAAFTSRIASAARSTLARTLAAMAGTCSVVESVASRSAAVVSLRFCKIAGSRVEASRTFLSASWPVCTVACRSCVTSSTRTSVFLTVSTRGLASATTSAMLKGSSDSMWPPSATTGLLLWPTVISICGSPTRPPDLPILATEFCRILSLYFLRISMVTLASFCSVTSTLVTSPIWIPKSITCLPGFKP